MTLKYEGLKDSLVKQVSFSIDSGQNVVFWGREGDGSKFVLAAATRFFEPSNNPDNTKGCVLVGNTDIQ